MVDEFGDRMKMYEKLQQQRFMPLLPVCVRLDGKSFSIWTKGLNRPFDQNMMSIMRDVTIQLVKETGACMGYTQSDEISLVLYTDNIKSQIFFDGKIQKIISVLAARTSVLFNFYVQRVIPDKAGDLAVFDCRAWQVPNKIEAANTLLWREQDATKNSISMAARSFYSHNELINKSGAVMQDMLMDKGVNWNNYPNQFKRGVFIQKRKVSRKFTNDELARLPNKHEALKNPDLLVERNKIYAMDMPIFKRVTNRVDVIFNGADPVVE